jgi:hypothetical protein
MTTMKHALRLGLVLYSKGIHRYSKMTRFNTKQLRFVVNINTLSTTTTLIYTADLKENNQREIFHFPQTFDIKIQTFQAGAWWGTQHVQHLLYTQQVSLHFNNRCM